MCIKQKRHRIPHGKEPEPMFVNVGPASVRNFHVCSSQLYPALMALAGVNGTYQCAADAAIQELI